jgi:hypothetical protein
LAAKKVLKDTHETSCDWTKEDADQTAISIVGDTSTVQGGQPAKNNFVHSASNPGMFGK